MKIKTFAEREISLHIMLNSDKFDMSLYKKQYAEFHSESMELRQMTSDLIGDGVSLHDCIIDNFSQKRINNTKHASFVCTADVYNDMVCESTRQLKIELKGDIDLRGINKREIYNFIVDTNNKMLLIMYWGGKRAPSYKITSFDTINVIVLKE